jgi:hypothetical protein
LRSSLQNLSKLSPLSHHSSIIANISLQIPRDRHEEHRSKEQRKQENRDEKGVKTVAHDGSENTIVYRQAPLIRVAGSAIIFPMQRLLLPLCLLGILLASFPFRSSAQSPQAQSSVVTSR